MATLVIGCQQLCHTMLGLTRSVGRASTFTTLASANAAQFLRTELQCLTPPSRTTLQCYQLALMAS